MGILPEFVVKHVRPYDADAYDLISAPAPGNLRTWLLGQGVEPHYVDAAFNFWWEISRLAYGQATQRYYTAAALVVSAARWHELYPTSRSSILFLTGDQLGDLSEASAANAGRDFDFRPSESIPVVVTIDFATGQEEVRASVTGARLAADAGGNCCHFHGLL